MHMKKPSMENFTYDVAIGFGDCRGYHSFWFLNENKKGDPNGSPFLIPMIRLVISH
jgi:hypothetical protein